MTDVNETGDPLKPADQETQSAVAAEAAVSEALPTEEVADAAEPNADAAEPNADAAEELALSLIHI